MYYEVVTYTIDGVTNLKIYLGSPSGAMSDKEKIRGESNTKI